MTGRERLLVALPRETSSVVVWADRWRRSQIERIRQHPLYGEILEERAEGRGGHYRAEAEEDSAETEETGEADHATEPAMDSPLGTLSIGVADVSGCATSAEALDLAQRALSAAQKLGNTIIVNHGGALLSYHNYTSRVTKRL
jgi:hypothetical protein